MGRYNSMVAWAGLAVVLVGILAIITLSVESISGGEPAAGSTKPAGEPRSTQSALLPVQPGDLPVQPPELPTQPPQGEVIRLPTPTPTRSPTPKPTLAPLTLPEVPPPAGGQVYLLTPAQAGLVGWARADDGEVNHFGDYNVYAGIYDGQAYVGGVQFDLSTIPAGSPIIHADLTLTGLSDQFLVQDGAWSVDLLQWWMDDGWTQRDFHWLARPDSAAGALLSPKPAADLGRGRSQTFFFPPDLLARLQDRLFAGKVSFRMTGPATGENNLFAWDSGFGAESLGRAPLLRIVAGPPPDVAPPSPTPDYVVITPVTDEASIIALAAERLTATAVAVVDPNAGTPTPTPTTTPPPPNWVTPVIIVPTVTPENAATAFWQAQVATAQAIVQGTPTPLPPNAWTATPTPGPTPTPALVLFDDLTPTATPTVTPTGLPELLRGKILFRSDRLGNDKGTLMVMNPDGSEVAVWTGGGGEWIYQQAKLGQDISPDSRFRVLVSDRQLDAVATNPLPTFQLFVIPLQEEGRPQRITDLAGMSYDAVWSPTEYQIAFVSLAPGNDEIFTIRPDGTGLEQLTFNDWEWDKHPSWSPDGSQIVFWSNRDTARSQIWVMNADGSSARNLSANEFNDWDPVWVK